MTQREVILEGGVPWGFRMHGGVDLKTPLKISRVNPGSKAAQRGIREGDLITTINEESTKNLTNNEAHNLLKKSGSTLKLGLNEDIEGSPKKRQYRTIHQETHQETVKRSSLSYTLKETIERSSPRQQTSNEFQAFRRSEFINGKDTKHNGTDVKIVTNIPVSQKSTSSSSSTSTPSTLVPEDKNKSSDHAVASRQSSYSNCSSIPDEGSHQKPQVYHRTEDQEMNDEQESISKSKKRRQRRKNLLNRSASNESQGQSEVQIDELAQDTNLTEGIMLEPALDRIEILRLKRIEHKYKVESPKELKIKNPKTADKKLKAKSKSLDDDDLLNIQELSEASESEDTKYQPNVIISEASSEENLLEDSDTDTLKKRNPLDSISLHLNDDNKIEAVSHISPDEEHALRTFLGGLNLVNSPEESAKDLYERTSGQNDPKAKKQQKRKELEEYFMPIAQNPRFLDAISEETSDISDKECATSSKPVHHLKQSTPEQDSGRREAVLVETTMLEPVQESFCSTQVVATNPQKAEVVYLTDSSASSTTSDDFDDAVDETAQEEDELGFREDINSVPALATETLKNDLHVESQESISTVISSHTSTSTKVGNLENRLEKDNIIFSQLTPPPTPDHFVTRADKSSSPSTSRPFFDYTKIPNILTEKEPHRANDNENNVENIDNDLKNSKSNNKEIRSVSAVHMSKKMVNGRLDNVEFRKVKVDEASKNGDIEVRKDFEEYITNQQEVTDETLKDASTQILINDFKNNNKIAENTTQNVECENATGESKKESVLKHVIMTSQDSNKTDSQKLLEFESIRKLNSELKDKIKNQELIGPTFKKSKSPANELDNIRGNVQDTVVLHCEEELPAKTFVQKRIKEFSRQQLFNSNQVETSQENTEQAKNLIQSRIKTFSNEANNSECGESVLKRIILTEDSNNNKICSEETTKQEVQSKLTNDLLNVKIKDENKNVTIEKEGNVLKRILGDNKCETDISLDNAQLEKIIPIKVETSTIIPVIFEGNNEKIAPIIIDKTNENSTTKAEQSHKTSKERVIPVTIENESQNKDEKIIPIKTEAEKNATKTEQPNRTGKERVIPVTVEKDSDAASYNKNEHIIPVKIESDKNENKAEQLYVTDKDSERVIAATIDKTETKREQIIPVKIETDRSENQAEQLHVTDKDRDRVIHVDKTETKSEQIIPVKSEAENDKNKTGQSHIITKERVIPVTIEACNNKNEKNIPVKIETDIRFTKEDIKNINISLRNMVEKKSTDIEESKDKINEQIDEIKIIPPVPPPRRSKAFLLRKRNEALEKNLERSPEIIKAEKEIPESSDITHTNVISPPRPASVNSDSTSSEESSRCTAKYNPNSSIADVASIAKDEESRAVYEPMSLRNLVLKVLITLPFGEEMLKELAETSKTLGRFIDQTDKSNVLANETMPGHWYTQKDVEKNTYEDERRKIIELHQKFLTRRKYNEGSDSNDDRIDPRETEVMSPNRLLTIIREEPNESEPPPNEFLYFEDNSDQRLKAKNLGEWLTLARNKSKSTSNLDSTNIPINNLRRSITSTQNEQAKFSNTRRFSLPQEIYEKQLIDIMEKEREIQHELEKLEEEKRKLRAEMAPSKQKEFQVDDFYVSKKGDFAERREETDRKKERPVSMPVFPTEFFRQQMYEEYMDKFSEREERKQQKVIKISSSNDLEQVKAKEIIHPIEIEQEFMDRVKEKLRKTNTETSDENPERELATSRDTSSDEAPVLVLDGDKVKGVETLPRHLQEYVDDLATQQDESIWSPGQSRRPPSPQKQYQRSDSQHFPNQNEPVSPVWTPKSATTSPTVDRKEFRPVNFQSPVFSRKNRTRSETIPTPDSITSEPPWKLPEGSSDTALNLSSTLDKRLPTSQSSPGFGSFSTSPRLPKAQNPTITLLQKAREGQLPRGAQYIDLDRKPPNDRPPIKYPGELLYHIKNEYTSESDSEKPRRMADLAPRKFEGIGPTTKDGMPLILRSEVKDKDQSKWYKRMYDTIHKQKPHRDEFITIKYKQKRAQYPYTSGYLSEPEPGAYDSDFTEYKYRTLDRRRTPQTQHYYSSNSTAPRSIPDNRSYSSSDIIRNTQERYSNQPGRIENYRPGHSSISEKEAKQWWDEVMDIFDGHLEQQSRVPPQKPRSFMNQALKESGYESDSTLVFKRKEETAANQLSPKEQREAYKLIQKGGDVPFQGLRKLAPERPKEPDLPPPPPPPKSQGGVRSQEQESPRKYVENEVTIHYKTPVRTEIKEYVSEDELAHRQAEAMKKIYEEERKRKYFQVSKGLQELQDMKSRRHTDNFIPSQKSPIPLNRYDDFDDLPTQTKMRPRSPEPRLLAKALYNFVGQTARELTFRKGDLIYVRRQVDKNWYEGELNAMVGLFPVNYVEIVPYEGIKTTTPRKAHEGQARAKYKFLAQTHLELSLAKGELVTITRKVDDNWFEGKIGGRKGIFPVSYVDVLIDPSEPAPPSTKPVASPAAHSLLLNGSAQGKESMGSHLYTPNIPNPITSRDNGYHRAKPVQLSGTGTYATLPKTSRSPIDQALHIETQSEPVPYRALYKYTPQNDDELELLEGDTVYVLEKCDDGWYVGSSERTGAFGTFPGNYVEKI